MKSRILNMTFSLMLSVGFTSCGGDGEFFLKKDLDVSKDKADAGTIGGKEGGSTTGQSGGSADGGSNGSTIGGTTASTGGGASGSATGGSTTGSTVGGASGSATGGSTTGSTVGGASGSATGGSTTGSTVGGASGSATGGSTTGSTVGGASGSATGGATTGSTVGGASGSATGGATTGSTVGGASGSATGGSTTGSTVGGASGSATGGSTTGSTVGGASGSATGGATTGSTVGGASGSATGGSTTGSTVGGASGSATGGATTGSTVGGASGSATGGATTGSTVGGASGSATGGSTTGSTVGGASGSATGGSTTGSTVGGASGSATGGSTGGSSTGSTAGGTTGGGGPVEVTETFKQADESKKLDIVWVIDNSGSMTDEQTSLGFNFSAFIDNFLMKDVDFKMAVTTTDTSTSERKGLMVKHSDKKLTSIQARKNPDRFKSDFRTLVKVGTRGSGKEKGLEASEGFMGRYAKSFLRRDAYLAVVIISDEEDQSSKEVQKYTDYLKTFKSSGGLVKLYSVVDVNNTNCCDKGVTTGSERYKLASKNTSGLIANIRDDFHNVLSAMGNSIIKLLNSFALAHKPIDGSLKVYVNGVLSTDYTYDASTHSIKFKDNFLPPEGAEIKVTYRK